MKSISLYLINNGQSHRCFTTGLLTNISRLFYSINRGFTWIFILKNHIKFLFMLECAYKNSEFNILSGRYFGIIPLPK